MLQHTGGPLWVGYETKPDSPWKDPLRAEDLPKQFRRFRGQYVDRSQPSEIRVWPEPYEKRLLRLLLLARKNRADVLAREGKLLEAAGLFESILSLDASLNEEPSIVHPLAIVYVGLDRYPEAEAKFKQALTLDLTPERRAGTYYFLAALCGSRPEGDEWKAKALASPELAPELRSKLEGR